MGPSCFRFLPTAETHRRGVALACAAVLSILATLTALPSANADDSNLKVAEKLAHSKTVRDKGCLACHTIGSGGGTAGPVLNQVGNRRSAEWLDRWLRDPSRVKPGTVMPNLGLSDAQVRELVGYLVQMKRTVDGTGILSAHATKEEAGRALFAAYDCQACHRLGAEGRFVGPNLTWLGRRRSLAWERAWLAGPEAVKPGTFMPDFHLPQGEIDALAAYVISQQGQLNEKERAWEAKRVTATPRERGKMIVDRFACSSCHGRNLNDGERNHNAAPSERVPAIDASYNALGRDGLKAAILADSTPAKLDPSGSAPPLACPSWRGAISDAEMADLLAYMESIAPKVRKRR